MNSKPDEHQRNAPSRDSLNEKKQKIKSIWSEQEDEKLRQLVNKFGAINWSKIAYKFKNRIGKQCRERWHNHIKPDINYEEWTADEEWTLFLSQKLLGNKWAAISRKIPGRTDNAMKNYWNSTIKKDIDKFQKILNSVFDNLENNNGDFAKEFSKEQMHLIIELYKMENRTANLVINHQVQIKQTAFLTENETIADLEDPVFEINLELFQNEELLNSLIQMVVDKKVSSKQNLDILDFIASNPQLLVPSHDSLKTSDIKNQPNIYFSNKQTIEIEQFAVNNNIRQEMVNEVLPEFIYKIPAEIPFDFFLKNQTNYQGSYSWFHFPYLPNLTNWPNPIYPNYYYPSNNYQMQYQRQNGSDNSEAPSNLF